MRELIAIKDFSYATRRLKAGDRFPVNDRDAKILLAIKKAEAPREPAHVPAPPPELLTKAETLTPPPAPEPEPPAIVQPVAAMSASSSAATAMPTGKPKPSQSSPRSRRRKSAAKKS